MEAAIDQIAQNGGQGGQESEKIDSRGRTEVTKRSCGDALFRGVGVQPAVECEGTQPFADGWSVRRNRERAHPDFWKVQLCLHVQVICNRTLEHRRCAWK